MKNQIREVLLTRLMGGMSKAQLDVIGRVVGSFVGDSVAMRILPCGEDELEYGFSGTLLGRQEYLQQEREHLFSRYGQTAATWTAVFQIAAIPGNPEQIHPAEDAAPTNESGEFSRAKFERIANGVLNQMEQVGIVEGPRWPSISVTPLGLYRVVPASA